MTLIESISSAAFMLLVVFAVLIGMYGCIRLSSIAVMKIEVLRENREAAKTVSESDADDAQA